MSGNILIDKSSERSKTSLGNNIQAEIWIQLPRHVIAISNLSFYVRNLAHIFSIFIEC